MTTIDDYQIRELEWELLSNPITLSVKDPGAFRRGLDKAKLYRNEQLAQVLELTGSFPPEPLRDRDKTTPGAMVSEPPPVLLTAPNGFEAVARWALPTKKHHSFNQRDGLLRIVQSANPSEVEFTFSDQPETSLTEWIVNNQKDYFWCSQTERKAKGNYERLRGKSNPEKHVLPFLDTESFTWDSCQLNLTMLPGVRVFVGTVPSSFAPKELDPGYIQYIAEPGKIPGVDQRRVVLEAISFAFGRRILSLGYTTYGANSRRVRSVVSSPYLIQGTKDLGQVPFCPSPLGEGSNAMHNEITNRLVNSIAAGYDKYGLGYLLWLYWHAHATPLETAPAAYGAAIEAVRNAYFREHEPSAPSLLPDDKWAPIRDCLVATLDENTKNLPAAAAADVGVIRRKIDGLNYRPSTKLTELMFEKLSLEFTPGERAALKERNKPAHGHRYVGNEYNSLLNKIRTLQTLFCRLVLRITNASRYYFDYSSLHFPIRELSCGCKQEGHYEH